MGLLWEASLLFAFCCSCIFHETSITEYMGRAGVQGAGKPSIAVQVWVYLII
jgi:hypothetical protein